MSSGEASNSICPAGWRLPSNSGTKSYYSLITTTYKYTTDAELVNNLGFVYSGYYFYLLGYVLSLGSNGRFWSSTAYSSTNAYILSFSNSLVDPHSTLYKGEGYSVRCVSR